MKQNIVITGASSGFGWAIVREFLKNPNCVVHGTSRTGRLSNADELSSDELSRLNMYALDLDATDNVLAFAKTVVAATEGKIDVLINNAGYGVFGALEDLSEGQIRKQMEVNFTGTVILTQKLLPTLRASKGHILNCSSAFGFSGFPMTSLYCASKFALEGWSEALRYELAPHGVSVSIIQPGAHRTKFGASVEWGYRSSDSDSAYFDQSQGYMRLLAKMRVRPNPARPESVARGVYKIVNSKNPPLRVRFGVDSKSSYWLRRILPSRFLIKLQSMVFRRLFANTASA